jgi:DUF2075 family protein
MRLYAADSKDFVQDANQNLIAEKLRASFFDQCRFHPSDNEVRSWRNSLRAMAGVVQVAGLKDNGVIIEYRLPLTSKRLDFMVTGRNLSNSAAAVIVELKQWERTKETDGERLLSFVGGGERPLLHPSVQVGQYQNYLQDTHTAFQEELDPVSLGACSYLHNYLPAPDDPLLSAKFAQWLERCPVFTERDTDRLGEHLFGLVGKGKGLPIMERIDKGVYKASRKLLDHVAGVIDGEPRYILLDEQLVAFDRVVAMARSASQKKTKHAIIVKGGPGTGKSVIAINLMSRLLRDGSDVHYVTGSRAFTGTLRKIIGRRGAAQFKYFNSYSGETDQLIDVLIADEAHRIRKTSNSRFTKKDKKSEIAQIEELLNVSKCSVFLIDDKQIVRPNEIGSASFIVDSCKKSGIEVEEFELEAQFRCGGSDGFVNWVNNTLAISKTANAIWEGTEGFEFKIASGPEQLEGWIREKSEKGYTARLAAGFCWKWSDPKKDGTLVDDVVVGDYKMPWDAKPGAKKLAKGIPPAELWAYEPGGINQVGCVYTAQGFEFDYVGVIFGPDLVYRFQEGAWVGQKENSADTVVKRSKDAFIDLVKNTYRVLLSRGMKGCYVYFMDRETEMFFRSRLGQAEGSLVPKSEVVVVSFPPEGQESEYLPLIELDAAAGYFGTARPAEPRGWVRVVGKKVKRGMFVSRIRGQSMAPTLLDGDYCVFEPGVQGSRQGKIVLAEHRGISDPESGGSYSVKHYYSEKVVGEDHWAHTRILLKPLNPNFSPIEIAEDKAEEFRILAEYKFKLS